MLDNAWTSKYYINILGYQSNITGSNEKNKQVLRVGMDLRFYPFTGMDKDGNVSGVEVDIAKALGKYLG
jgi:polar amino acid transport system substrate-binding protein